MKRIKDTLDEPFLVTETDHDALYVRDIKFENDTDGIVSGYVLLTLEDYSNLSEDEDEYYGETESDNWEQGFLFDADLVRTVMGSKKYVGDKPTELAYTISQIVKYDGGTQFSGKARYKLNAFIVETYLNEDLSFYEQFADSKQLKQNNMKRVKDGAGIISEDLEDAINAELSKLGKGIQVWHYKSSDDRVIIATDNGMFSKKKDGINNVMSDFGYTYNKSYPMLGSLGVRAYIAVYDKKVSDSRRVKDGLTRSERYNRNMEKIFASAERFNQNQMKWLREQGVSEDEIENAKRNTGLHGSELSKLVIQTARANGDTRENSEILGEAMGISDSRTRKGSIGSRIADAKAKYFSKDLKNLQAYRRVTDSEGKIKEDVVFLIEDSDVLAVFPNTYGTANRDQDTMVCYSHNGQHGVCTYDYANTLKTADSKQYNDLKDELANYVGYNLTIVDSLPSEAELKQNGKEIRDSYIRFRRGLQAIDDARMLARGEEIEYKGKRGTVQYALFHGQQPVIIRWQNEDGSEEFEVPYNQVASLKIHDSEDDTDVNVEPVDNDSDIDENEVTDGCGKKKGKKKTADGVKRVKITKRQTKKTE